MVSKNAIPFVVKEIIANTLVWFFNILCHVKSYLHSTASGYRERFGLVATKYSIRTNIAPP